MSSVTNTIALIKNTFPNSRFEPVKKEMISRIENQYSKLPENLKGFYEKLGYGSLGNSYYMIHALIEPEDIYDSDTAKDLKGKIIVGDDFGGICHAYDTYDNWCFGYIDEQGVFEKLNGIYPDFISFLNEICIEK